MIEETHIDRNAIVEVYRVQNLEQFQAAVKRGEWTPLEAMQAHGAFMGSKLLQQLVDNDVERLEAHLAGRVH